MIKQYKNPSQLRAGDGLEFTAGDGGQKVQIYLTPAAPDLIRSHQLSSVLIIQLGICFLYEHDLSPNKPSESWIKQDVFEVMRKQGWLVEVEGGYNLSDQGREFIDALFSFDQSTSGTPDQKSHGH